MWIRCADGIVRVLQKAPAGERYVLGGENVTQGEFYRLVASLTGVKPPGLRRNPLAAVASALAFITFVIVPIASTFYFMAARDPAQHWGLVFIGLLAKVMGAGGMTYAVFDGQVSSRVLWLLPINDVIWWLPFWIIFRHGMQHSRYLRDVNSANAAGG